MSKAVLAALVGVGLVVAVVGALDHRSEAFAQRLESPVQPVPGGDLIVVPGPAEGDGQLLTVIDPKLRVMSVYHIGPATTKGGPGGRIRLCSVRAIRWDLQMMYLNNESPLPQEIRSLLEQR